MYTEVLKRTHPLILGMVFYRKENNYYVYCQMIPENYFEFQSPVRMLSLVYDQAYLTFYAYLDSLGRIEIKLSRGL